MSEDTGSVVTVQGRTDPGELGVTLPHEHLFSDWSEGKYEPPESAYERQLAREAVSLENLWYVHRNPTKHRDNLRLSSFDEAVEEVAYFHRAGGDAIVDVTPKNTGGDPEMVRAVSRETGVTIIHGTSFYTHEAHPDRLKTMSVEEVAEEFIADVRDGIGNTDVRAGIIGEIGLTGHIHDQEEKVLRAGARAATRTGASITIHPPGRTPHSQRDRTYPPSRWGLEILDIAEEEGLPPHRIVIGHMDRSRWYEDLSYQEELASRGAYVEYDLFGQLRYFYIPEYHDANLSDVGRAERIVELVEAGHIDRLLLSQDVFLKCQRRNYGGFGYGHILGNVVPILEGLGLTSEQLHTLLVENPRRVLTFAEPME